MLLNDRRGNDRTQFITDVTLRTGDTCIDVQAEMENISIIGFFVRTEQKLKIGDLCDVTISISAKHSKLTLDDISAEVIRVDEEGMGLRFTSNMEWYVLFRIYTHHSKQR